MEIVEALKNMTQITTEQAQQILLITQGDLSLAIALYFDVNNTNPPQIFPNVIYNHQIITDKIPPVHRLDTSKITNWIEYTYTDIKEITEKQHKEGYLPAQENERCTICLCDFEESDEGNIVKLSRCGDHFYHKECMENCRGAYEFVRCPICGIIYGILIGDMPPGIMTVIKVENFLPLDGYEDCATYEIIYKFPNGVRNGTQYKGTKRIAFLPDNQEGNEVLRLFQIAFERKITFTVGRSVTTGQNNMVTWNGIHHKTSPEGGPPNFGYPDETYFLRVKQELAAKGIY